MRNAITADLAQYELEQEELARLLPDEQLKSLELEPGASFAEISSSVASATQFCNLPFTQKANRMRCPPHLAFHADKKAPASGKCSLCDAD